MPYRCMNPGLGINVRLDKRAQRRSAERVASGSRWEFVRGMYGNVYEVVDHEEFRWYRQDMPVDGQGDMFEGFLPFCCDYCSQIVDQIKTVTYRCIYWYYVRPRLPTAEWKQNIYNVHFACCAACQYGPLPLKQQLLGYHLTELYQDGHLIFSQERRS